MRAAAFWSGKTTRSHQSHDHNLDGRSRQCGNACEPEELSRRNPGQVRLLVRGTPGQMVELIDWSDFVKYLDELRQARAAPRRRRPFKCSPGSSCTTERDWCFPASDPGRSFRSGHRRVSPVRCAHASKVPIRIARHHFDRNRPSN